MKAAINTIHVPQDAGEYEDDLRRIMMKIPDGWGRWISCSRGWYPLIIELDQDLEALIPGYEVHQIKEKFGTLRYYFELPQTKDPYESANAAPSVDNKKEWSKWEKGWQAWADSADGKAYFAEQKELLAKANYLVAQAEKASARTCEVCGKPGKLNESGWLKTLCEHCQKEE